MAISEVKEVAVGRLRPNPANARTHSKKQIGQIARSIQQFGFTSPIVVDENWFILAGHGRWLAANALGLLQVPVVVVSGLSQAERQTYLITDNKLTENAGWDRPKLAAELHQLFPLLETAGLDIELTGFSTAEIDALSGDLIDPEQDPADELPEIAKYAVSRRGDCWQLGHHRMLCGDARNPTDFHNLMGGDHARMVFTDPPYNMRIFRVQGRGKIKHRDFLAASGEMRSDQFIQFLRESFDLLVRYSVEGSVHFVFMDWRHVWELLAAGRATYSELKNLVIWVKTNAGQGSFYRSQHELIFVFKNGNSPHVNNVELGRHGRNRSNVWTYPGVNTFRTNRLDDLATHPTVKPIALVADAMRDCSRRGDVVLDPFLGSGTTIMAAERVGRRCYGLELDPLYVDAAVRRWQHYTRRDATLSGTGETFNELPGARIKTGGGNG